MDARNNDFPLQSDYTYQSDAGAAIGTADILWILRRGWRFPAVGCLIGLMLAAFYAVSVPTVYTSNARILVDRSLNRYLQSNKIVDEPTFDQAELESQIHILSSESIVLPVVRSMNLANDREFIGPPDRLAPLMLWYIGELIKSAKNFVGWGDDAAIDRDAILERVAVEAFLQRLSVYRVDVANVINVSFASEDPNKAADIANAVADTYLAASLEAKSRSTKLASQWLQDRLMELKVLAADAEQALQGYKFANNLVNAKKNMLDPEQLTGLNTQLANARIAMTDAKARFDRIQQTISEGIPSETVTDALTNSVIVRLRSQYLDLTAKAAEIEARVGPEHMAVIKIHERANELLASIRAEEQRIAGSYASEYQIAKARENQLAATIAKLVEETKKGSQALVTMRDFESSADTFRQLYSTVLQKFQEMNTNHTGAIAVQDARVVTRAAPPLHRSSRKTMLVLAGSLMLGLFLGAGTAVAREWVADVFRTPNAVTQATGVHCLILPMVQPNRKRFASLRGSTKSTVMEEFVLDEPFSRSTETLRGVKALINAAKPAHGAKVVGVVSSVAKEGKTTIAANLATLLMATPGVRTLLVDGDLHLRLLTARLAPDAREGLIEALADPSRLAKLVYKRQRSGVDILPCVLSSRIPNAADLLGSSQMEQLLADARKAYDYIIIEIPPIMSVVDIKVIERSIDCFIFVVEWGQTTRSIVQEALSEAEFIRDRLLSIVLNKADPRTLRTIEAYKGHMFKAYYEG